MFVINTNSSLQRYKKQIDYRPAEIGLHTKDRKNTKMHKR